MRFSFATGLITGLFLASMLVAASTYLKGTTTEPALPTAGIVHFAITSTTTTASSSTTQTSVLPSVTALQSNVTASAGAGNNTATNPASQATVGFVFGPGRQSPSSLATMVEQPGLIPLLLLPIVAALVLGLVLYKASKQKE